MILPAQCVMCFRNAEAQNLARAESLNWGILVLLVPLAASLVWIAWLIYSRRNRVIRTAGARD